MQDITGYNARMSSSILDKLFFMKHIDVNDVDTLVDFGCANAELFKQLPYSWTKSQNNISINFRSPVKNHWKKIGIDNSEEMLNLAKQNFPEAFYIKSFEELQNVKLNNAILNLSSVIHEIYSYYTLEEIENFWEKVFKSNFKYIVIRDMMVTNESNRIITNREKNILIQYNKNDPLKMYDDFHRYYPEMRVRDMLHFMQKNRYIDNWDRECKENYFPITLEYLLSLVPKSAYVVAYLNTYCLPYVRDRIKDDFYYNVHDTTHVQLILKRVEKHKNKDK